MDEGWRASRRSKAQSVGFLLPLLLAACGPGELAAESLEIDVEVRLEQEERSLGEGYVARYRYRAVHTTADLRLESKVSGARWSGYETCFDPPARIDWESDVDFSNGAPDFHAVVKGSEVWLLYDPALELEIEHAGRPACDSGDAVTPGSRVGKRFFTGDLAELAEPAGDVPAHLREEELAMGGFVLAVLPLDRLDSGEGSPIAVAYESDDGDFAIALRVEGTVRPAE